MSNSTSLNNLWLLWTVIWGHEIVLVKTFQNKKKHCIQKCAIIKEIVKSESPTSLKYDEHNCERGEIFPTSDEDISEHWNLLVEIQDLQEADGWGEANETQNHEIYLIEN